MELRHTQFFASQTQVEFNLSELHDPAWVAEIFGELCIHHGKLDLGGSRDLSAKKSVIWDAGLTKAVSLLETLPPGRLALVAHTYGLEA